MCLRTQRPPASVVPCPRSAAGSSHRPRTPDSIQPWAAQSWPQPKTRARSVRSLLLLLFPVVGVLHQSFWFVDTSPQVEFDFALLVERRLECARRLHKRRPFEPVPDFLSSTGIEILHLPEEARQGRKHFDVDELRSEARHGDALSRHPVGKLVIVEFDLKAETIDTQVSIVGVLNTEFYVESLFKECHLLRSQIRD